MIFLLLFLKEVENRDFSIASASSEVLVTRGNMDLLWLPLPMELPISCSCLGFLGSIGDKYPVKEEKEPRIQKELTIFCAIPFILEVVNLVLDTVTIGVAIFGIS